MLKRVVTDPRRIPTHIESLELDVFCPHSGLEQEHFTALLARVFEIYAISHDDPELEGYTVGFAIDPYTAALDNPSIEVLILFFDDTGQVDQCGFILCVAP